MNMLIRWPLVLVLGVALIGAVGCGSGGSSGGDNNSSQTDTDLIVQQILPTNGQEVETDLVDVDGEVTIIFSAELDETTVLDYGNGYNGLTSSLNILDSAFLRVPGTPTINYDTGRGNVLTFVPSGGVLPNGQYTVTASRQIKSASGKLLNSGAYDHRSSFTVGTDTYKPVIRNTFPVQDQKDIPKDSQIIMVFNESVDPTTVTNTSITVVSGNPPTTIPGTLKMSRDDFEVVWTPNPDSVMPPNSTVVVTITGGASGVTDMVGNTFEDPVTGQASWQFTFETVVEPPPPNNPISVDTFNGDALVVYGDNNGIGTLQEGTYLGTYPDLSGWLEGNPIENGYRKIGNPGEIMFDTRFNPTDSHTWIYVTDSASGSVTVVGSRDSQIVGKWKALPDPVGLGLHPSNTSLYVSNFAANTVSVIDLAATTPGAARFDDKTAHLADPDQRLDVEVGRGPLGLAHSIAVTQVFVANNVENSCTVFNSATTKHVVTFNIGTAPSDVATTVNFPNVGYFAFISCLGGGADIDGSVSVYWNVPNGLQANVTGFKNPKGIVYDYGSSAWVANSGGNKTSMLTLQFAGGGFAATIFPAITVEVETGANPTDVTISPLLTVLAGSTQCVITANRGVGELSFIDAVQPSRPFVVLPVPGVKMIAGWLDQ